MAYVHSYVSAFLGKGLVPRKARSYAVLIHERKIKLLELLGRVVSGRLSQMVTQVYTVALFNCWRLVVDSCMHTQPQQRVHSINFEGRHGRWVWER